MKYNKIGLFVLLLATITFYAIIWWKVVSREDLNDFKGKFLLTFTDRQKQAEQVTDYFRNELGSNDRSAEELFVRFRNFEYDAPFSIRISKNSEPFFWNDQKVLPDGPGRDYNGLWKDENVSGIFYFRSENMGVYNILIADQIFAQPKISNEFIESGFCGPYRSLNTEQDLLFERIPENGVLTMDDFSQYFTTNTEQKRHLTTVSTLLLIALQLIILTILIILIIWFLQNYLKLSHLKSLIFGFFIILGLLILISFSQPVILFFSQAQQATFSPGIGNIEVTTGLSLLFIQLLIVLLTFTVFQLNKIFELKVRVGKPNFLAYPLVFMLFTVCFLQLKMGVAVLSQMDDLFLLFDLPKHTIQDLLLLLILIELSVSFLVCSLLFFEIWLKLSISSWHTIISFSVMASFLTIVSLILPKDVWVEMIYLIAILLVMMIMLVMKMENRQKRFLLLLGLVFVDAIVLTWVHYRVNETKSDQMLALAARQLNQENDPLLEFFVDTFFKQVTEDQEIKKIILQNEGDDLQIEQKILTHLRKAYFGLYFEKYEVELTFCREGSSLILPNQSEKISCYDYFDHLIKNSGKPVIPDKLFRMEDNMQGMYYIVQLPVYNSLNNYQSTIYIEFYRRIIPEGLGFLALLTDDQSGIDSELAKYSIAFYTADELVYKTGDFLYPKEYHLFNPSRARTFQSKNYRHHVQQVNDLRQVVVSQPKISWTTIISPFSFFFFVLFIPAGLLVLGLGYQSFYIRYTRTFRFRLQTLILNSLLFSFLSIGAGTIYYITEVYRIKSEDFLFEKTQSILIELEHKFKNEIINKPEQSVFIKGLLQKFSVVFFSDIHVYDTDGQLIASSREDIFETGLQSRQMNPEAYWQMKYGQQLYFYQNERIGHFNFLSSYAPFHNQDGALVAFVNLPYFAKEAQMKSEISSILLTYINLLIFLSVIATLLVLLFSKRLLQPLQMIQEKMRSLRVGSTNERISLKREDELGQLVAEYNNLIDALEISAEKLAQSERESAWREMARQIAHEIKNPLTPMRLSVQYLLRAWNDKDDALDEKIRNISQTLINQIDTLSEIASAFSDFSRMPQTARGKVDLVPLLKDLVLLFDNHENIRFQLEIESDQPVYLNADQPGLNRVFTNLLKNSIQAIGDKVEGSIQIIVTTSNHQAHIALRDNGKGMQPEEARKVFSPNFTTKTSGMGIGLAMVYNIVKSFGGDIRFETASGRGTTFFIQLPLHTT